MIALVSGGVGPLLRGITHGLSVEVGRFSCLVDDYIDRLENIMGSEPT